MSGTVMFDIRHIWSVRDIPDGALDPLATSLYSSSSWLRFQETERAGVSSSYLLACARGGTVAAALPMYRQTSEANPNYLLQRVFPAALADDGPQVLIGNRHGYDNALLAHPGLTPQDRQAAFAQLVGTALELVRRDGVKTAWWPYLDNASMLALRPLLGDAVPVAMKSDCSLRLTGTGFSDYLGQLSSNRRTAIKAERRRFAAADYGFCGRRLSESVDDVARLGVETVRKHGGTLDGETARNMTAAQAELLDDVSIVLTCTRQGRPVGIALVMDHNDTSYVRTAGFDYARTRGAAEYFELVFYRPIERAYSLGITNVSLGVSSYRAKTSRGARLRTRWALPLLVPAWPEATARRHNAAQLNAYEQDLAALRRAIPYADYEDYC
jgi:uncharacterized protein